MYRTSCRTYGHPRLSRVGQRVLCACRHASVTAWDQLQPNDADRTSRARSAKEVGTATTHAAPPISVSGSHALSASSIGGSVSSGPARLGRLDARRAGLTKRVRADAGFGAAIQSSQSRCASASVGRPLASARRPRATAGDGSGGDDALGEAATRGSIAAASIASAGAAQVDHRGASGDAGGIAGACGDACAWCSRRAAAAGPTARR